VIQRLLDEGQAYRCYCTKQELEALREEQMRLGIKPRYDGRYREHRGPPREGVEPVIRFKNPTDGDVVFDDRIRGRIAISNAELDDLVIARSDGTPTYNFTVVVDDMDMGITHVIRGDDHINNTPRQINILRSLDQQPPIYAHVPMILGDDGKRLSKRHGALSVMDYHDQGCLPEALLNYLVRLGWSYGDQEIFTLGEMIDKFDLGNVNRAASTFNTEKLLWLNHQYIMNSDPQHVARHLSPQMGRIGIDPTAGPDLVDMVVAQRERSRTLVEMAEKSRYFYQDFADYDEKAAKKNLKPDSKPVLEALDAVLSGLGTWDGDALHRAVADTADSLGLKLGKVAQPLRVAVVGGPISPSIDVTLELLGRGRTLERIQRAIHRIDSGSGQAPG